MRDNGSAEMLASSARDVSVLVDLRPCYQGYAGIPLETRLLFRMLHAVRPKRLGGLLSGLAHTHRPVKAGASPFDRLVRQTAALIAQNSRRTEVAVWMSPLRFAPRSRAHWIAHNVTAAMRRSESLDLPIDPSIFEDYIWTEVFAQSLPPSDRPLLADAEFYATRTGGQEAQRLALLPRTFRKRLCSEGWDVMLSTSPSPYRVAPGTQLVVRYYDMLPLTSPHTVGNPYWHARIFARMLKGNVADGAVFVCDSEPVRSELLSFFPALDEGQRAVTIPAMLATDFWPDPQPHSVVRRILRRRAAAPVADGDGTTAERDGDGGVPSTRFVLAVSALEPRKNFGRLMTAFEAARERVPDLELVVVGNPGWRHEEITEQLRALVRVGAAHHLTRVPADELRILYSAAHVVVSPSRAEGFGYSGVEAMACGTPVIASDLEVHRWVYGDAAVYFDPYDAAALAVLLAEVAAAPKSEGTLPGVAELGLRRAARYRPEALRPAWEQVIERATARRLRNGAAQRNAAHL